MHESVQRWGESVVERFGLAGVPSVLEVGSRDVNGSLRGLFSPELYVGVDMTTGPGVDVVALAKDMPFEDGLFDVVVCTEMLEHDREPWLSLPELARVLRLGGYLLLSTRGPLMPQHDYPSDFYRYTVDAIVFLLGDVADLAVVECGEDPGLPGVLAVARKVP